MAKVRLAQGKKPVEKSDKPLAKHAQVEVRIGLMASNGDAYRDETLEEMIEKFREFASENWPIHHNFTVVGSYYLIDGKVCLPQDFDRETMNRKPGTHPPSWSLGGDEKKDALAAERERERVEREAKAEQNRKVFLREQAKAPAPPAEKKTVRVVKKKPEPVKPKKITVKTRILKVAR